MREESGAGRRVRRGEQGRTNKRRVPLPKAGSVGVRELKASLSGYLRRVRDGEPITVTDHGRPVARLVPVGMPEGLERLMGQPWFQWSGQTPELVDPPLRLRSGPSAAEMVDQMRRERDDELFAAATSRPARRRRR